MDHYIKLGKRYKDIKKLITVLIVVAIIMINVFFPVKLWLNVLLCIVFVNAVLVLSLRIDALENKFLYNECNPFKYYCVKRIDRKSFVTFDDMMAISALGDFNRAAGLLKEELAYPKNKSKYYINNLKLIYAESLFSAGDYEACCKVSADFQNQYTDADLKNKLNIVNHNLYSFFGFFIKKDYEACLKTLDTLKSNKLKYHNLFKCKMDYYYAITYYYSNNIEKAKEHFEKIKDINDSLYYSKKAREYLENINEEKFLELNFDEIPKFEGAPVDVEAKKKADRKMWIKALISVLLLIAIVVCAYFFVSANVYRKGTAEEVISYSMDFDADVKTILPIENEDAALCVFQDKDDLDYLYVAYLESYENGLYSYGIEYSFLGGEDGVYSLLDAYDKNENISVEDVADALHKNEPFTETFDDYEYYFSSGKKDITVVFKIARSEEQIPDGINSEEFVYTMANGKEKTYYIYVSKVVKENKFGYSGGIYF